MLFRTLKLKRFVIATSYPASDVLKKSLLVMSHMSEHAIL